jgi:hypothetical protein
LPPAVCRKFAGLSRGCNGLNEKRNVSEGQDGWGGLCWTLFDHSAFLQNWERGNGDIYYDAVAMIAIAEFHLGRLSEELPLMKGRIKLPVLRSKSESDNQYRQD